MRPFFYSLLFILAACDSDEQVATTNRYCNIHAHFACNSVSSMPATLMTALNGPGMWCTVQISKAGDKYEFALPTSQQPEYWNITSSYTDRAHAWVAGLIVGLPNTPEPGADSPIVTCYDLVCPRCYAIPVDRQLRITTKGSAECEACGSAFDLNNQGTPTNDKSAGKRLFRYKVTYLPSSNTLVVNN